MPVIEVKKLAIQVAWNTPANISALRHVRENGVGPPPTASGGVHLVLVPPVIINHVPNIADRKLVLDGDVPPCDCRIGQSVVVVCPLENCLTASLLIHYMASGGGLVAVMDEKNTVVILLVGS